MYSLAYEFYTTNIISQLGTTPDGMMVRGNNHPYIVAYGTSKKDISKFYIEVEKHLMAVIIMINRIIQTYTYI